jgi:hypothetical protein
MIIRAWIALGSCWITSGIFLWAGRKTECVIMLAAAYIIFGLAEKGK